MRTLALFTPWPPQHSGIADYAFDLATGLAEQGVRVSVFTDEPAPAPAARNIRLHHSSDFPGPRHFDRVVYQMGNNARFHSSMIVPLGKHGGIVHLHDMVLHHLINDLTSGESQGQLYYGLLQYWYGDGALKRVRHWNETADDHFMHSSGVTDIPLFDPILRFAQGCIVHSQFCQQRIKQRFPSLPCEVIPQTYLGSEAVGMRRDKTLRIGAFGNISPSKHIDKLLVAAAAAITHGAEIHVDIAGSLDGSGPALSTLADELDISRQVTFHDRVTEATFLELMRSMDVCVALRFPTMGETSGVVSRALQMGIPTIVNDIGWYAELPPCVAKLPVDDSALRQQLCDLLLRHATNTNFHERVRSEAAHYAHDVADFDRVNRRYISIVDRFPITTSPRKGVREAA